MDVEILGFGGTPGDNNQVRLAVGTPANGLHLVAIREQRFDADGRVFYVMSFDPGVTPTGTLTRYFAKQN